jgi:tryptophan-rich sensory protein
MKRNLLIVTGIGIIVFDLVFVSTSIDEFWSSGRVWFYGIAWAAILFASGVISLAVAFKRGTTAKVGVGVMVAAVALGVFGLTYS